LPSFTYLADIHGRGETMRKLATMLLIALFIGSIAMAFAADK